MPKLTTILVGVHFHPPAKTLLACLPAGLPLWLRAEPENPYDPDAILVLLEPETLGRLVGERPEIARRLEDALPAQGATLEQVISSGPLQLGHVAASGGKPLAKAQAEAGMPSLSGTMEWKEALEAGVGGTLEFAPSGVALVTAEWEEEGED